MNRISCPHMAGWTFLTNHAHVLQCVAKDPGVRLRDIASCVGITERAAHRIVCELEQTGYLSRRRNGARNSYTVHSEMPLRNESERQVPIREILDLLLKDACGTQAKA